jgi:hypothetical protein
MSFLIEPLSIATIEKSCSLIVDEYDANTTYICKGKLGEDPSVAGWQIAKLVKTGNVTRKYWADGDDAFDNIADNRTTTVNYL